MRVSWTCSAKSRFPGLHIFQEGTVRSSSVTPAPETYYPAEVAASTLHQGGVTGRGVTVAVLDTGVWRNKGPLQATSYGRSPRVLAQYDVILDRENPLFYATRLLNKYGADIDDLHGHGTHVSSVIASSAIAQTGRYQGVAPGVNLVSVRVLDSQRPRPLLRCDPWHSVGREQSDCLRHPCHQSFVERNSDLSLLGGSTQPGRDGRLERGHRRCRGCR